MILLDTHTLIWWANNDTRMLPTPIFSLIQREHVKGNICVSSISFWEIAYLCKKDKVQLKSDLSTWVEVVLSIPSLKLISPDVGILIKSVSLEGFSNKDPADRIIVATAQSLGATIITKDEKILNYKHVRSRWE